MRATLAALTRLADLPILFGRLGFRAAWEELPASLASALGPRAVRGAVVARADGFPWLALEAPGALIVARRAAKTLERAGRTAGIAVLDPAARELALGVAFGHAPAVAVALDRPAALDVDRLTRLRAGDDGGPLALASRLAAALDAQGIDRAFFRAVRATLDAMTAALPARARADDRHALALLQLVRVLFLYFVQSRGWLDGRPDFLARAVDGCLLRKRSVHRTLLQPLFFGTLNRPPAQRGQATRAFGAVPFLNGGLFEPHPLERRWSAELPNTVWRDAFDGLFERFHFTIREGDASAVAPDMLGRVFEGVMDPDARHASGSFYTPSALVRDLLRAALVPWLSRALGRSEGEAARLLESHDAAVARALAHVTVLDPAVGSGAFLLGALELLAAQQVAQGAPPAAAKRAALAHQLFGVDRNPSAVRLCELRLWLSVLADDGASAPEDVAPLPNLDALVRQGDSLLDPIGGGAGPPATAAGRLSGFRAALVHAHGDAKRRAARALREAELSATVCALETALARADREIRERLEAGRARGLFGDRAGLDAAGRRAFAEARAAQRRLRAELRAVRRDGVVPWFHFESHFGDVAARGGFDLVVGNPPWVRGDALPAEQRNRLAARYGWWRRGGVRGFANAPDLSVAFVERAFELVRRQGTVALLLPEKIATADYASRARAALAARHTLHRVAPLGRTEGAVFEATVYPLAFVASPGTPPAGHTAAVAVRDDTPRIAQAALAGGPWMLRQPGAQELTEWLRARHPTLAGHTHCGLGVKTGADAVFLADEPPVEPALLRWAIRGRDVGAFRVLRRMQLIWTHADDGRPLAALPPLAARHFRAHHDRLRARADFGSGPPWILFRTRAATAAHRVVWSDLANRLRACALGDPRRDGIPLNTCLVAPLPDAASARRAAAWLNAPSLNALARLSASPAAGGCARYSARAVGALPLPTTVFADADLDHLAAAPLDAARRHDLDAAVRRHLDLPPPLERQLATLVADAASHRR